MTGMAHEPGSRLGPPEELSHGDFEMVVRRLADDLAFGTDASLFTGSGIEYAQSRPYEPGDPIKQIDWRMTARTTSSRSRSPSRVASLTPPMRSGSNA